MGKETSPTIRLRQSFGGWSPLSRGEGKGYVLFFVHESGGLMGKETSPTIRLRQGFGGRSPLSRGEGKGYVLFLPLSPGEGGPLRSNGG
jgi:hypothetical protein